MSQTLCSLLIHCAFHKKASAPNIRKDDQIRLNAFIQKTCEAYKCRCLIAHGPGDHMHLSCYSLARNNLIGTNKGNKTHLNIVSQRVWCGVLSPLSMASWLWRVLCFWEIKGCSISVYCSSGRTSPKIFSSWRIWNANKKRRCHPIQTQVLLAVNRGLYPSILRRKMTNRNRPTLTALVFMYAD